LPSKSDEKKPDHISVMMDEVQKYLCLKKGGVYLDVTFGVGGHTKMLLDYDPTCRVIALDWDHDTLEKYGDPLKEIYGDRLQLIWGNFALLYKILKKEKVSKLDGILADFGTSQRQIRETPGISFSTDTYLDMRLSSAHQTITAADFLAQASEALLSKTFFELGGEQQSRAIARRIVNQREQKPITHTKQLVSLLEKVILPYSRKVHIATKVFQALRIYVNQELRNIHAFFPAALNALKSGGSLVCISFHSLEDSLVKDFYREQASLQKVEIVTSKVCLPTEEEITRNPSARSAKLRAAVKK